MAKTDSEHLISLREQRAELARSIDHWSQPGAVIGAIRGMQIKNGTVEEIENDKRELAELDRRIADEVSKSEW